MEVKVCKNCRRLFKYIYGPEICPDCILLLDSKNKKENNKELSATLNPKVTEDEEKFQEVKTYITKYPASTIMQIAEANEIPPGKLFEWIREERLEFSENSKEAWFKCCSCGTKIKSGIFCSKCKIKKN